ncbi:probable protein S-acyltransferase 7 isoform X2 [Phoenix dactylifera]|uniref:S-acyltransferase n=1 Tax=Phoenix dactylifera TaxID=42345 RepID=A0A8B8J8X0_PHODC|nr:probable protein S-acyltransferase 7 isoform X2 [Phoenix dactylifera]
MEQEESRRRGGMYVVPPPRGPGPAAVAAGDDKAPRVYEVWMANNIFFLKGRKLMDGFSHHLGISIMVVAVAFTLYDITLLLLTSGRDPGIIPRSAHPPEPEDYAELGDDETPELRLPRIKEVVVNGVTVKIKYCDTCMLYRPPRCSHCSICDNCVERFDHHCPWVGQCVGLVSFRNYRFFYMFVFSTTLLCLYVFGFCWVYIIRIKNAEQTSIWRAMIKTPASIVLIIYTFVCVWFVGGLSVFHLYLISTNQTTYENFRKHYDQRDNPYNRGVVANFKEIFFTSIPPSKNKFRARAPLQRGLQTRSPSGGFISPNMGKLVGDLEMGRKPVTWDEATTGMDVNDLQAGLSDTNILDDKNGGFGDVSPDLSREVLPTERFEGRAAFHPRRPSWGRRSGSWEMSPEVLARAARDG